MATAAVTRTIEEEVNLDLENLLDHGSSKAPLKSMLISKYIILLLKILVPNTWYHNTRYRYQEAKANYKLSCMSCFVSRTMECISHCTTCCSFLFSPFSTFFFVPSTKQTPKYLTITRHSAPL